jgi:hypothetical protein
VIVAPLQKWNVRVTFAPSVSESKNVDVSVVLLLVWSAANAVEYS